jgi:flagellar hook-associated protein 3 FlgL
VQRSVGDATKVRVDTPAAQVFGTGSNQLFTVLKDLADHMRNDPSQLQADLARLDSATRTLQSGMSGVGARYNQVERMSNAAENRVAELGHQLSEVEDVDITRSLIDLSLQQTAYQAALAAGAKVVQPSLVDFLR